VVFQDVAMVALMICDNCKIAGGYNRMANQLAGEDGPAVTPGLTLLRQSAEGRHEICTDINCTCQHIVGQVLNHERISREDGEHASQE
jgi:hypothetical protein